MKRNVRKKWIIRPDHLPVVLRRCPKCGKKTEFENSGRFRVNANGCLLDVWLIYRCSVCETTWNMAVYERVKADSLDEEEYMHFMDNDIQLAAEVGSRPELFAANRAEWMLPSGGYTVTETDTPVLCRSEQWKEVEIQLAGCLKPRVDALFAKQLGISRSKVKALCEQGSLCHADGAVDAGSRVKDGQIFHVRCDLDQVVFIQSMIYTEVQEFQR